MPVRLDFDLKYREEADPWGIGHADAARYDAYRGLLLEHATRRGSILDIGCGLGAFLARFAEDFESLNGVDVSSEAIRRAAELHPSFRFLAGSAPDLDRVEPLDIRFDAVVFSDVINYFSDSDKSRSLSWIARHLHPEGIGLVAAWSPGGAYLDRDEFHDNVRRHFRIERELVLETGHVAFVVRPKRFLIAMTVDYETWQPIPADKSIDWDADVFDPCDRLMAICERLSIPLTVMAELGEYFWLEQNDPAVARRMEGQWQSLIRRGHDVQIHLHPSWLPETGAVHTKSGWYWDSSYAKADAYPGDLTALLRKCRERLENLLRPVDPTYRATCFRAGAYQVQPFGRLSAALVEAGYECDSSVWAGGFSEERGYDFRYAFTGGSPYFASPLDPQLKSPPAERGLVEIPVWTPRLAERWSADGKSPSIARPLREHFRRTVDRPLSTTMRRRVRRLRRAGGRIYFGLPRPIRRAANRTLPRRWLHHLTDYGPDQVVGHEYFVMIGHTKVEHDFAHLERELAAILNDPRVEPVRLSEMSGIALGDLRRHLRLTADEEARYQVAREYTTVLGDERNEAQSRLLQELVPLDAEAILDLGCGAGHWAAQLARDRPWSRVVGVDVGEDFIAAANAAYASDRAQFNVGDFQALPIADGSVDCVYADNTLEHAFDVAGTLREVWRVLAPGGSLVAAIPSDARNPRRSVDNHTWKTLPRDVATRLEMHGFEAIHVKEIDRLRGLSLPPYPPSDDQMIYVTAIRPIGGPDDDLALARRVMNWTYRHLDPSKSQMSSDPLHIVREGHAWCWGYARVLSHLLQQRGYSAAIASMVASEHERGRGPERLETHEVVVARLERGEVVLDAMTDTVIPHPLADVLADPLLATPKPNPDDRYASGRYHLYDTGYWYSRVRRYSVGDTPRRGTGVRRYIQRWS